MNEYKKLWIGALIGCAFTISTIILLIHVASQAFYPVFIDPGILNSSVSFEISEWYIAPVIISGVAYLAWEYKYGHWNCGRIK